MLKESVQKALNEIKPSLEEGVVKVRLTGACNGCPMSAQTLKNGIERLLKSRVPEVHEVVKV